MTKNSVGTFEEIFFTDKIFTFAYHNTRNRMRKEIYIIFFVAFFFLAAFNANLAISNKLYYRKSSMSMTPMNDEKLVIKYIYDGFGNRIKRELTLVPITRATSGKDNRNLKPEANEFEIKIKVYPNPSQGMFWVNITGIDIPNGAHINVYSSTGVLVKRWTGISSTHAIDISMQPNGMYFLQVKLNKDNESVWKIIKN